MEAFESLALPTRVNCRLLSGREGGGSSSLRIGAPRPRPPPPSSSLLLFAFIAAGCVSVTSGIGCYKCTSTNGDNPYCEDPFNTTFPGDGHDNNLLFFEDPCMTGRKDRNGLFPASVCVKIKGTFKNAPRNDIIVRTCSVDSNSLTMDTEIARIEESCGLIDFADDATWESKPTENNTRRLDGCIAVCDEVDGCNGAPDRGRGATFALVASVLLMMATSLVL